MDRRCDRCRRDLPPGEPAWILRLEAYADFDGTLRDLDEEVLEALVHAHEINKERYTILGDEGLTPDASERLARITKVI